MKILTFLAAVLISESSYAAINCTQEAETALHFVNQYIAHIESTSSRQVQPNVFDWLKSNKLSSPSLAVAYKKLEAEGLKEEPEMGWGFDIIIDGQDYPEKGYKKYQCMNKNGFVHLQDPIHGYKTTVRVELTSSGFKVVGSGIVNIPKNMILR